MPEQDLNRHKKSSGTVGGLSAPAPLVEVNAISNEEIVRQIKDCAEEKKKLFETLYLQNLPMMKKAIKPFLVYAESDELLNVCFLGLCDAVEHYEEEKGTFGSYAFYWYRESIMRFLENGGFIVRLPAYLRYKIWKYKKCVDELYKIFGRMPTDEEVSDYMNIDESELQNIKNHNFEMLSLDAPIDNGEDKETILSDNVTGDFDLENTVLDDVYGQYEKEVIWGICKRYMDDTESTVLCNYYKQGKTQKQIAAELGLSHQRVRQIHQNALRKMRRGAAKREILERLEILSAGEYRAGLRGFKEHQESKVEYLALKRAEVKGAI